MQPPIVRIKFKRNSIIKLLFLAQVYFVIAFFQLIMENGGNFTFIYCLGCNQLDKILFFPDKKKLTIFQ